MYMEYLDSSRWNFVNYLILRVDRPVLSPNLSHIFVISEYITIIGVTFYFIIFFRSKWTLSASGGEYKLQFR